MLLLKRVDVCCRLGQRQRMVVWVLFCSLCTFLAVHSSQESCRGEGKCTQSLHSMHGVCSACMEHSYSHCTGLHPGACMEHSYSHCTGLHPGACMEHSYSHCTGLHPGACMEHSYSHCTGLHPGACRFNFRYTGLLLKVCRGMMALALHHCCRV